MDLSNLKPAKGSNKKPKRIGRGPGSGHGKTSGKGHKGQLARSGINKRPWFEGGQMPLQRRVPKRGFTNISRIEFSVVNIASLNKFESGTEVTPEFLRSKGLVKKNQPVKILGNGELKVSLKIIAHAYSESAVKKIEEAGGSATKVGI